MPTQFFLLLRDWFRTRLVLQAEILALRHQLLVLQRAGRDHRLSLRCPNRCKEDRDIDKSSSHLLEDSDALKKLIFQEAGCEFDLDSRKETSDALGKVEALREWITSRSLTQSGMEQLAWRHRLVEQIVKYRRVCKRLHELDAIRQTAYHGMDGTRFAAGSHRTCTLQALRIFWFNASCGTQKRMSPEIVISRFLTPL